MINDNEFVISRAFAAPLKQVWRAWTDRGELERWWGPKGFPVRECTLDLRRGGIFHYCLAGSDGTVMWGKWAITDIVPEKRLEFIVSFSDANAGGPTRHPFEPDWPLETASVVEFSERDGHTGITVRWTPHNATETERRRFAAGHDDCRQGWTGTFDQLDEYLSAT